MIDAPIHEPAVAACSCFPCTHPDGSNVAVRLEHAERHAEFRDWLTDHTTVNIPKPSYRTMLLRVGQEYSVPTGACHDPRCHAALPHPVHIL